MTGYGRGTSRDGGLRVAVELSSVNRRQLDMQFKLPGPLVMLEGRVTEEVRRRVHRGRITGEVEVTESAERRRHAVSVDTDLAQGYVSALRDAARKLHLKDDLSAGILLELPDVVRYAPAEQDAERIWPAVRRALQAALRDLDGMRRREGATLQHDLEQRLDALDQAVTAIEERAPGVAARHREALIQRLRQADVGVSPDEERLLREVALFADRSDVTEETTRLRSHLQQSRRLMRSRRPSGRSLDFMAQELLREYNTIASKANDGDIVRLVVAAKAELERLREQVQNVE
jgi:uncharacterized protein (TIGR00255 family)